MNVPEAKKNLHTIFFWGLVLLDAAVVFSRPAVLALAGRTLPLGGIVERHVFFPGVRLSVSGIFPAFFSVLFVLKFQRKGFLTQLALNCVSIVLIVWTSVYDFSGVAASDAACPILIIFVSIVLYRQLTNIKKSLAELNRIAFSDDLTGLANRKKIVSNITNFISGDNPVSGFSIMFIDMDNFKFINDSLCHQIGDIFLNEVVHNIKPVLEPEMMLGRMGGDEFLVLIPSKKKSEDLLTLGYAVGNAVSLPFLYKSRTYSVTCSIGIARYPDDGKTVSDLLRFADIALYQAKTDGRNRCMFFNDSMRVRLEQKVRMEHELHEALRNHELYLEFQPQFFLSDRRLRGLEVLTRWNSPVLGKISPSVFIPLAEGNGDILSIGKWIMLQAFTEYVKIYEDDSAPPVLAVNVSAVQFRDHDFIESVKDMLRISKMKPDNLEFEITESVCLTSPVVVRKKLEEIHNLGI